MSFIAPFPPENESDDFGDWPQWRKDMGLGPHRGKDFNGLPVGTAIPASGAGRVTLSKWNAVLGWVTVVYYPEVGIYLGYCHMNRPGLPASTELLQGDKVGEVGNTGSATIGPHLHLTASWYDGDPGVVEVVNPMQFFTAPAPAGDGLIPISNESEEDDMRNAGIYWVRKADGKTEYMVFNTVSGFRANHAGTDGPYNNSLATAFNTPSWAKVTESHAQVIIRELDRIKAAAQTVVAA